MVVGVTGPVGAGKTTFVEYLCSKGFERFSLSDMIRDELVLRRMDLTRKNLQDLGNEMRQKYGSGIWAEKVLDLMHPGRDYVIDSIRNPGEIKVLAGRGDFVLFLVDALLETRFSRISLRSGRKEREPATFAAFKASEAREYLSNLAHSQQLAECGRLADIVIVNDCSKQKFFSRIDAELERLEAEIQRFKI